MMAFLIWPSAISAGLHLVDFNTAVGLPITNDTFSSGLIYEKVSGHNDVAIKLTLRTQNFSESSQLS